MQKKLWYIFAAILHVNEETNFLLNLPHAKPIFHKAKIPSQSFFKYFF